MKYIERNQQLIKIYIYIFLLVVDFEITWSTGFVSSEQKIGFNTRRVMGRLYVYVNTRVRNDFKEMR